MDRPWSATRARRRRLRLETLEGRYVLDGAALADDAFQLNQNGPQVELDVLANDVFDPAYEGARLITSVSYGSEGGRISIAPGGESLLYTPPADFAGAETFVYAVDGEHTARVQVSVRAPLTDDWYEVPPTGQSVTLEVMENDPFWEGYTGARRITSVSVSSGEGTIEIGPDGRSVIYASSVDSPSKETFIYVVDNLYPAQVTIEVPKTLEADEYELVQHAPPTTLHVLANDPFWSGYSGERRITHVTESQLGAGIQISEDGRSLIYEAEHATATGWDSFRYVVDGTYEATVSLIIHRPVVNDGVETDQNSTNTFFDVLSNDRYRTRGGALRDVIDVVTSVTQPESGGTVSVAPGGQGVLYTPPEGFSGADTFTYIADGVHEATVYVQVTRPVRDDYISSGVYQDTPSNVVSVLANDFLGNGYAGAKVITSVGPTENGGQVTIRADGKAILYTPAAGYTGQDTFTYTVDGELSATATIHVAALAQNDSDSFYPDPNHAPYVFHVLANDFFDRGYPGEGVITGVEVISGSGQAAILSGGAISFAPSEVGSHQIQYTVDGQYQATQSVYIRSAVSPDLFAVDQNSDANRLQVLANDFNIYNYHYPGPRLITGVTQSVEGGTVLMAPDGRSVYYTPPEDFRGRDSFTYTVDGYMTTTVSVEVIRRVRDDQFRVDAEDGAQALPVLVNDLLGADYAGVGRITGITAPSAGGSVAVGPDGKSIVYAPAPGFEGTDTFVYTVDGALKAEVSVVVDTPTQDQYPTFESVDTYFQFLLGDALERYQNLFGMTAWHTGPIFFDGDAPVFNNSGPESRGHSETNVQVAGVDEGDIVEFDSNYVYALTDEGVTILDAWPAEDLHVVSEIDIEGRTIAEYLHGDRLTVISEVGGGFVYPWQEPFIYDGVPMGDAIFPYPYYETIPPETIVTVIDVTDRAAPTVVQSTKMEGRYVDSRAVGDFVYALVNNQSAVGPAPQVIDDDGDPETPGRYETTEEYVARVTANVGEYVEAALPGYTTRGADGDVVRTGLLNTPETVHTPLVADAHSLISIVSFNVESNEPGLTDTSAVYSTGAGAIYASLDSFYVFDTDHTAEDGAVTRIVKFDWRPEDGNIELAATTSVAGVIVNQFSADENGDYLRIATSVTNSYSGNWSGRGENLLFVLQEDAGVLEFVGAVKNWALDENIRSVRFLGDRAFVTTFRNVDPLFALDLSDPTSPEAIGHITLPGFTSYMHLVDENHLLTVGRNTPTGLAGPTQVSLFDISDLTQPLRVAEHTFPRFSTSEAEVDHHAFGFFVEHGLLGVPIAGGYIERVDEDGDGYSETRQWVDEHRLAVFSVDALAGDPEDRLSLATEIEHADIVRRSGYIGDKLYSVARDSVKVVDVAELDTVIAEVSIAPDDDEPIADTPFFVDSPYPYPVFVGSPPSLVAQEEDPAIEKARAHLAGRLGLGAGAPLLVTAEATPDAPGGGSIAVFRVGAEHYTYRVGQRGLFEAFGEGFEFDDSAGAWNAVAAPSFEPPAGSPGDYNWDGAVDAGDYAAWRASYGDWSLTTYLAADGNGDGIVNTLDFAVWRENLGRVYEAPAQSLTVAAGSAAPASDAAFTQFAVEPAETKATRPAATLESAFSSPEARDDGLLLLNDVRTMQRDEESDVEPGAGTAEAREEAADDVAWENAFDDPFAW